MASIAAIQGVQDNGREWKRRIKLSGVLEKMKDHDSLKVGDIIVIRDKLVDAVQDFVDNLPECPLKSALGYEINDLLMVQDDIDEMVAALHELYDVFDYHRVLVV